MDVDKHKLSPELKTMEDKMETTHYSFKFTAKPFPPDYQHIRFCPPPSLELHPDDLPWFVRPLDFLARKIAC